MVISLIAAMATSRAIGVNNSLPWHLPADLRFFSSITKGHCVLMGRKNYESLPERFRPLPNRTNLVLSRSRHFTAAGAHVFSDLQRALQFAEALGENELFVVGGEQIYRLCMPLAHTIYLSYVEAEVFGDAFFPPFDERQYHKTLMLDQRPDEVHSHGFKTYKLVKI